MELIRTKFGTERHKEEIRLREKVLRDPLGLKFRPEDLEAETDELRFGLLDSNGELAACLLVRIVDETTGKLRQMAVRDELRGKGIGKELIEKVESELKKNNFKKLELHSRMVAEGFYLKLGYTSIGKIFTEVGIPHIKMIKDLRRE